MKAFYRTSSLLCLLMLSVFLKEDITSIYSIPRYAMCVVAPDYDLDGDHDIVIGHDNFDWAHIGTAVTIMKNISYGTLEVIDTSMVFPGYQNQLFSVDVNNDGYPDIVSEYVDYPATEDPYIRVYYNENGTFPDSNYIDFPLVNPWCDMFKSYGDINGDGWVDILVESNTPPYWGVLYNDGTGHFSVPHYYALPATPISISCGDLDNNGRDDVIITGQNTEVRFSYSTGFQRVIVDTGYWEDCSLVADVDMDGNNDILTEWSGLGFTGFTVFKNNGNKTFTKLPEFQIPGNYNKFLVSDFNNDNLPDVLFKSYDFMQLVLYYNLGNCQFGNPKTILLPSGSMYDGIGAICAADMDNNGYNDILAITAPNPASSSRLNILFNDGQGNFGPDPIVGMANHSFVPVSIRACPNPFQDEITFRFDLPETSEVSLNVFDIQGNFIICLTDEKMKGGYHSLKWRGLDQNGQSCKPGAYIVYLSVNVKICHPIKVIKI